MHRSIAAFALHRSLALGLLPSACSGAAGSSQPAATRVDEASPTADPTSPDPGVHNEEKPRGKRAPCTLGEDQSCNDDPSVSALWGRCTELGVCECNAGFERSPTSDLCRPAE